MQPLDNAGIREAFDELAQRLTKRGVHARIYVAGGAAMALMHDEGRLTRDVDASITFGYEDVIQEVHEIARERGWPTTWLNEQATMYMPPESERHGAIAHERPGLSVVVASVEHMIAMKARSARRTDESDFSRLLTLKDVDSSQTVAEIVSRVFPGEPLGPRQTLWVDEIVRSHCGEVHGVTLPHDDSAFGSAPPVSPVPAVALHPCHHRCGTRVKSTGLPCRLRSGHRGNHRSR